MKLRESDISTFFQSGVTQTTQTSHVGTTSIFINLSGQTGDAFRRPRDGKPKLLLTLLIRPESPRNKPSPVRGLSLSQSLEHAYALLSLLQVFREEVGVSAAHIERGVPEGAL
jgi:hypothetical protein